ncbi:MAG: O-antigen ligase family protein, partial [Patescibacteria group bacterium]
FTSLTPGISLANIFGNSILRPYATFSHPNSLGGYFLVVGLTLFIEKRFAILWVFVSVVLVVLSFSQAVWFTLVFVILLLVFSKNKKHFKPLVQTVFLGSVLFSLVLPVASKLMVQNYQFSETVQKRLELNVVSQKLVTKNIVTGVGLGNFIPASVSTYKTDGGGLIKNVSWFLQPVHNIYLLVLSETGIVGLLIFFFTVRRVIANANTKFVILLVPILLTGLVDHYWLTLQQNFLLFSVVVGIVLSSDTITSWKKKS